MLLIGVILSSAFSAILVFAQELVPPREDTARSVFRGFFYGALRNWKGPWPAALLTGLAFCIWFYGPLAYGLWKNGVFDDEVVAGACVVRDGEAVTA